MRDVTVIPAGTRLYHHSPDPHASEIETLGRLLGHPGRKLRSGNMDEGGMVWFEKEEGAAHEWAGQELGGVKERGDPREYSGPGRVFTYTAPRDLVIVDRYKKMTGAEALALNEALGIPDYKRLRAGDALDLASYRAYTSSPRDQFESHEIPGHGTMKSIWPVILRAINADGFRYYTSVALAEERVGDMWVRNPAHRSFQAKDADDALALIRSAQPGQWLRITVDTVTQYQWSGPGGAQKTITVTPVENQRPGQVFLVAKGRGARGGRVYYSLKSNGDLWAVGTGGPNTRRKFEVVSAELLESNPAHYWGRAGAGLLLTCQEEGDLLLVLRSQDVQEPGTWGIPGGSISGEAMFPRARGHEVPLEVVGRDLGRRLDELEAAKDGAMREAAEELGMLPNGIITGRVVYRDKGFTYTTFVMDISPEDKYHLTSNLRLNWENDEAAWFTVPEALALPNLHFGARYVLERL